MSFWFDYFRYLSVGFVHCSKCVEVLLPCLCVCERVWRYDVGWLRLGRIYWPNCVDLLIDSASRDQGGRRSNLPFQSSPSRMDQSRTLQNITSCNKAVLFCLLCVYYCRLDSYWPCVRSYLGVCKLDNTILKEAKNAPNWHFSV